MLRKVCLALALASVLTGRAGPALSAEFEVEPRTVVETKAVFGQVMSRNVVPARARIGGTIQSVAVDEGSHVEEGEVVAVVLDEKLDIQRQAASAQVSAIRSQLDNAQTDLERAKQLVSRGTSPQSRLDQAQTQVDVYTNQLQAAQAEQSVIEQRAREGDVLAPATGRVLDVPVTQGSVIMPGEQIATIAGGGYFLRLSLPERHAAEIAEGDPVEVGERALSADGSAERREGRLVKVYPQIAQGRVEADVEVSGLGDYFVGERTLVWIPVAKRTILAVPPQAVVTRHGVDMVRIATGEGTREVPIVLGETIGSGDDAVVEVLTGLRAGDRVVTP